MMETMEQKTERNCRVQARYNSLMREGKRGHYETIFRVVREEVEAERERCADIVLNAAKHGCCCSDSEALAAVIRGA